LDHHGSDAVRTKSHMVTDAIRRNSHMRACANAAECYSYRNDVFASSSLSQLSSRPTQPLYASRSVWSLCCMT